MIYFDIICGCIVLAAIGTVYESYKKEEKHDE